MKTRERIKVRLEQSRTGRSAEDIWFYSDIGQNSQAAYPKRSIRTDRQSVVLDKKDSNMPGKPLKLTAEKEHSFVVDWQISDVIY
jgi:hypothetical protein